MESDTGLNQSTILSLNKWLLFAQFGQMAGKTCQGHFKDNIHMLSHFSMLRKCMSMPALALTQYWALTLEGHAQQVGTCLKS